MSNASGSVTSPDLLSYIDGIDDPRQAAKTVYLLEEIFLLVLCAVISGAQGWVSITLYGRKKFDLLRRFLPFEDGCASHDQLENFIFQT